MASLLTTHSLTHLFFYLATYLLLSSMAFGHEFRVGGPRGWIEPIGDEFESYNHWATRNRFHIGDYLYFKYENDSVLVVTHDEYKECNTTNPIAKFTDGDTKFRFDRYGFFYFISGEPSHCWAGQRLIVRVMVHPETVSPGPAPFLGPPPSRGHDTGPSSGSNPGSGFRFGLGSSPSGQPGSSGAVKFNGESATSVPGKVAMHSERL
ncbi:Early nodulin-like protein 1 [Ananas comosus]|uniref:Early nodulin-like protein 1 n=1 Tax=Ananas comosus TaxID=4615 RepID=A0A199UM11_ANACO|nr:Early nodulin-like protein 1 [Ananas comosus]